MINVNYIEYIEHEGWCWLQVIFKYLTLASHTPNRYPIYPPSNSLWRNATLIFWGGKSRVSAFQLCCQNDQNEFDSADLTPNGGLVREIPLFQQT